MEPEELSNLDVLELHNQGLPVSEIYRNLAVRAGVDPDAALEATGQSELDLIRTFAPNVVVPAGTGEARMPEKMRIDFESLQGRSAGEIARYVGAMMGVDADALMEDQNMAPEDIILSLVDERDVMRAPQGGFLERFARGTTRAIPSVLAGTGAAFLTAPSGPIGAGVSAIAAGEAAKPIGASLEEAVFGPRVPLVPSQQFAGRVGDVTAEGVPYMFAPWQFTQAIRPQTLTLLANRSSRVTPAESIAVQSVTRPGQALLSEGLALPLAAAAGVATERQFPGNELARVSSELAAGALTPAQTLSEVFTRVFGPTGPIARGVAAAVTRDPSRLSTRVVMRGPENEERLFNLSNSVDRAAVRTLQEAGWETLRQGDPTGAATVYRLRSERALERLVARLTQDFRENPVETANLLRAAANDQRGLNQLAAEYGISPDELPESLPVAALVDSPSLRAVYATIQSLGEGLGPTNARARAQEVVRGFEGIENIVRLMSQTGDPEDFADAQRLQLALHESALDTMIDTQLARVTQAVSRLNVNDPNAGRQASKAISEAIGPALSLARRQETQLWNQVDRNDPWATSNTAATLQRIRNEIGAGTPQERLESKQLLDTLDVIDEIIGGAAPAAARDGEPLSPAESQLQREAAAFAGGAREAGQTPTINDALRLKSRLLRSITAANSAANPDFGNARFYNDLYQSVMDDLGASANAVAARGGEEALTENQLNLLRANSFSRALNDTFTRAFAGEVLARNARGGERQVPELLGERILSGSDNKTDYVLGQLDDAVTFVLDNVDLTPEERALATQRADTLRGNQETLIRLIASRVRDPNTGEINLRALRTLTDPNNRNGIALALRRFPNLERDLMEAETAQTVLNSVRDEARQESRQAQDFLGEALRVPPGKAVGLALGDPGDRPSNSAARLRNLIRLANQNGGEFAEFARRGLFDTIMDRGLMEAGFNSNNPSFEALREFFFQPLGRATGESSSVAGILREQGFLTDTQLTDLQSLLRQGQTIQRALGQTGSDAELKEALKTVSPFNIALLGRFLGAAQASRLTQVMRTPSLIIQSLGANVGQQLAERIPTTSMQDVLTKFLDDPDFAEIVLRRAGEINEMSGNRAIRAGQRLARDFQSALVRNGLIAASAGESERLRREGLMLPNIGAAQAAPVDEQAIQEYLNSVQQPAPAPAPVAPPPTPQPAPLQQGALPPAAAPLSVPQAGGQSRASYSALFPNDPISPMVQQRELQQGIGSLMGGR